MKDYTLKYPTKIVKQMRFISFDLKVLTSFEGVYGLRTLKFAQKNKLKKIEKITFKIVSNK